MSSYSSIVKECDEALKAGRPQSVTKRLARLNASKVPREWRLPLANISRRAGLDSLGMKLLSRVVRPQNERSATSAAPAELAEYAVLLMRTGALNEAQAILERLDGTAVPEVLLSRAFLHFARFDFRSAIPELETYLKSPPSDYAGLVGRVNLAFAYVASGESEGRHEREIPLEMLDRAMAAAGKNRHARIESNCYSLRAQLLLQDRDFKGARAALENARRLLGDAKTNDNLFIDKWRAFVDAHETRTVAPILAYRERAEKNEDWDGMREADLHHLKIAFEKARFNHLIFGTPFTAYREQIFRELGRRPDQSAYVYGSKAYPRFDLISCEFQGESVLKPGRKCHQLIDVLLYDFYRPLALGAMFSELFPGEHFDIFTSPDRVHQLIRRTRRWLKSREVPVVIHEAKSRYSLRLDGKVSFRIPLERHPVDFMNLHFEALKKAFRGETPFSARQARETLGLGRTTVQRLIHWGIDGGKLEKLGAKNFTLYRLRAHGGTPRTTRA